MASPIIQYFLSGFFTTSPFYTDGDGEHPGSVSRLFRSRRIHSNPNIFTGIIIFDNIFYQILITCATTFPFETYRKFTPDNLKTSCKHTCKRAVKFSVRIFRRNHQSRVGRDNLEKRSYFQSGEIGIIRPKERHHSQRRPYGQSASKIMLTHGE